MEVYVGIEKCKDRLIYKDQNYNFPVSPPKLLSKLLFSKAEYVQIYARIPSVLSGIQCN